ncbi:MAG: PAS domain-containing protein, partial [Gammaproteobacteria bacterium]|nr:PAS domain-containing protein [Gammaproteobacteria bacterium]
AGVLLGGQGRPGAAALLGLAMLLLAGLTLVEHATGVNLGIDLPLTAGRDWGRPGTTAPGRMGVPASVSWTLLGAALVLAGFGATRRYVAPVAGVVILLAALSLAGYLYGADLLMAIPRLTTIALLTSLLVLSGAIGVLLLVPGQEPVRTWLDDGPTGILVRRSVPVLVAAPVLIAWVTIRAEESGVVDRSLAVALLVVLVVAVSGAMLWRSVVAIRIRERAVEAERRARGLANYAREQSEARVASILESIDDAFVIFDRDWRYTYLNAAAARAVARRPEELLGRCLWDLYPELAGTPMETALRQVAEHRVTREFEVFNPVLKRWFSNRAYPTPDGGVSVYFRDVEDQRRMQQRAFRSEQQAQTLIRHMPGGVFMVDRDFRFLVADGAGVRESSSLAGKPIVGRTLEEVLDPEMAALFRPLYTGALAGVPFVQEDEHDGRVFNTRGVPLRAEDGTIYAVLAISHDITARKREEQATAAAARQLHLVTDVAPVMLAHLDTAMRYKFVNRPYAARFGLAPADLVGRSVTELFGEEAFRRFEAEVREVLAGRPVQFEVEMAAKPGSEPQYMYAAYTPELDGDGRVVGLVAGIVNITERRRAEQAVRDADRRKDEFLATLAHELRNPLAPISNSIDILGRSGANPALLQTVRDTLRRQVSHLTKLVDDLLDVGRISRNKLELRREDVTLAAVLEHSMEACGPMIGEAGQRLAVQLPDQPVVVHGDPVRLSQIFSNLLTNASRYNHQGGHIALSAALDGGEVVVRVRDSGIGIPADQLGAVFEPFFQVRDAASRESGGLGIGLSLVKRLVELHGGSVAAASAGAGERSYADGVCFVALAGISTAAQLVSAGAHALGLALEPAPRSQRRQLIDFLRHRRALLILDNF